MALTKEVEVTDAFGDQKTFKNAYIRVENISGNKHRILIDVKIYRDSVSLERPIKQLTEKFAPELNGDNFIAQSYMHLKTTQNFGDALDC